MQERARNTDSAEQRRDDLERDEAEMETVQDSIENLDEAPPNPLLVVPRPMAYGAMFMSLLGAIIAGGIGFGVAVAIYGLEARVGLFAIVVASAVAGLVAGGVMGGWMGGVGAKARDEMKRGYAGHAPGTRPVRRSEEPKADKPIGWE